MKPRPLTKKKICENTVFVALTFDVENDVNYFDQQHLRNRAEYSWAGVEKGIPIILEILGNLEQELGEEIRATWFVRTDATLGEIYGNEAYLWMKYKKLWKKLIKKNHELGFHPHLYRRKKQGWALETRRNYQIKNLQKSYSAIIEQGFRPISARIGEAYMTNEIMRTLAELGISIDSTAMPGRFRRDPIRNVDWRGTPQLPYRPSRTNYRVPGKDPLPILEVPMSMIRTKVEYDKRPLKRYINLSFHGQVLEKGLEEYIRNHGLMVSVTHPFEILPETGKNRKHPLISFDPKTMQDNLRMIVEKCAKSKKNYLFITLSDILDMELGA